jgi:hypothetical protein
LQIALYAVETSRDICRLGAAITGADRVDKDQVSLIQPGVFVVHQFERRWRHISVIEQLRLARPHCSHMYPDRSGAGAAVEGEGQWPAGRIGDPVQRIGHIEDMRLRLASRRLDRHLCDGSRVFQRFAIDVDLVTRDSGRLIDLLRDCPAGEVLRPGRVGITLAALSLL